MSAAYMVVPIAQSEAVHEALGRLYAESEEEVWPIRSHFVNGDPDPDLTHATFYYVDARAGANGTQVGFPADEDPLMTSWLGREVETTLGTVTLPAATTALEDEWFA